MHTEDEIVEIGARALAEESTGVLWDQMSAGQRAAEIARSKREIRAALAALREAGLVLEQGWQTMETAPRERTIQLWVPEFGAWAASSWKGQWSYSESCWVICTGYDLDGKQVVMPAPATPTHWRPLPAPPTDKGGA